MGGRLAIQRNRRRERNRGAMGTSELAFAKGEEFRIVQPVMKVTVITLSRCLMTCGSSLGLMNRFAALLPGNCTG